MRNRQDSAYWIQHTHLFRQDEFECSACGHTEDRACGECPACGARMHSSKYDPSFVDEAEILSILFDD